MGFSEVENKKEKELGGSQEVVRQILQRIIERVVAQKDEEAEEETELLLKELEISEKNEGSTTDSDSQKPETSEGSASASGKHVIWIRPKRVDMKDPRSVREMSQEIRKA